MIKIAELSTWPRYFRWEFPTFTKWIPTIEAYIKDREYVYDSDNCGDHTSYYAVVDDGNSRFYKCTHSWYWENYGQENSNLVNDFDIVEVLKSDLSKEAADNCKFVV